MSRSSHPIDQVRLRFLTYGVALGVGAALSWWFLGRGFWSGVLTMTSAGALVLAALGGMIGRRQATNEAEWQAKRRREIEHEDSLLSPNYRVEEYGVLGEHRIEGDTERGMFVEVSGRPVFISVPPGSAEGETFARRIAENADAIGERFNDFAAEAEVLASRRDEPARILSILIGDNAGVACGEVGVVVGEIDDSWGCVLDDDLGFRDLGSDA